MRKRIVAVITVIMVMAMCIGCSAVQEAVAQVISGDVTGKVGKTYQTQWFTFSVDSIEEVADYAGYQPASGNVLVDVLITETGTYDSSDPSIMGTFDFYLHHEETGDYWYPMDPFDGTMMPESFPLAKDETVTYHMVYEIPDGLSGLGLYYVEVDEEDNYGNVFCIPLD